jgi:hypothetical protein
MKSASIGTANVKRKITEYFAPAVVEELQRHAQPGQHVNAGSTKSDEFSLRWNANLWAATSKTGAPVFDKSVGKEVSFTASLFFDGNRLWQVEKQTDQATFVPAGTIRSVPERLLFTPTEVAYTVYKQPLSKLLREGSEATLNRKPSQEFGEVVDLAFRSKANCEIHAVLVPSKNWAVLSAEVQPSGIGSNTHIRQQVLSFQQLGSSWLPAKATYEIYQGSSSDPATSHKEEIEFTNSHLVADVGSVTLDTPAGTMLVDQDTLEKFVVGADGKLISKGYARSRELGVPMVGRIAIVGGVALVVAAISFGTVRYVQTKKSS